MSDRVYLERCSYALFFVMIVNKQQKIVLETERIDKNTGHTNRNDNWNKSHKERKKEEKKNDENTMKIVERDLFWNWNWNFNLSCLFRKLSSSISLIAI